MSRWTDRLVHTSTSQALAALIVVVVAGCSFPTAEEGGNPLGTSPEQPLTVAPVTRQDLTMVERLDGVLGYSETLPLAVGRDGVVTWMPDEGAVIRRGEVVLEIDGIPIRLLYGDRPAWRRLAVGEPEGPDILQLNDNLAALGYADRDALPEDVFDWRTRAAVRDWQEDLGLKPTGAIELGDVVFLPPQVRVGNPEVERGMWVSAGQTPFHATAIEQVVTVDLDPASLRDVAVESRVTVVMPDRARMEGTVHAIGDVVSTSEEGEPVVTLTIELSGQSSAHDFHAAPVTVLVDEVLAEDVLVVPIGALLASPNGGYSVELVTGAATRLVAVEPGGFADGLVEITGDVVEGDEVLVPS